VLLGDNQIQLMRTLSDADLSALRDVEHHR
jgi:hypothetical protein